jgi:hypothetical protein
MGDADDVEGGEKSFVTSGLRYVRGMEGDWVDAKKRSSGGRRGGFRQREERIGQTAEGVGLWVTWTRGRESGYLEHVPRE